MTKRRPGPFASDLFEEAVRLLRRAPLSVLIFHPLGSIPCVLGALYFFFDMSSGTFAADRHFSAALGMAGLYLWMKCCHAEFCARLRAMLLAAEPPPFTFARLWRMAAVQATFHPVGILLRLAAASLALPYVWTAVFLQNISVLGDGTGTGVMDAASRAWTQAKLWPKQAHLLTMLLTIFGFFVWLNVTITMILLPALTRMFFGIETAFTRHPMWFLNPTFLLATLGGLYLCLDPIRKAVMVARCFHGASLHSGEDLELELRRVTRPAMRAAATIALAFVMLCTSAAPVARAQSTPAPAQVEPARLDRAIDGVLERREFAWRDPRDLRKERSRDESWFARMRRDFQKWLQKLTASISLQLRGVVRKIADFLFGNKSSSGDGSGLFSWLGSLRGVIYALLTIAVVVLAILIVRSRRRRSVTVAAQAIAAQPDVSDEEVTADQLPEDGWLQLARELADRGETRLALRAFYLSALAHLGQREMIRLARHKSNRDYDRELRRRAKTNTDLLGAFDHNLRTFERSWYGDHEVTREVLGDFAQKLERIRAC